MKRLLAARRATGIGVVAGLLAILIAGGGYALASGGGTITACVHKHGGALTVGGKCAKPNHTLTWNKVGQAGPAGPAGSAGSAGSRGATGVTGSQGATGLQGVTGSQGATGVTGAQGVPGPTYWVVVSSAGAILRQSGGWTLTHPSTGSWIVDNPSLNESTMGVADAAFRGPGEGTAPTFVTVYANDSSGFYVETYNSAGTAADLGFSLIMTG